MTEQSNQRRDQICAITVMDTTDPDISFDANGVCHYVHEFQKFKETIPDLESRELQLEAMIASIKKQGIGKQYDCIIGLSGGVDSSYVAYLAHQWGLRPLVVHFDNGWNSELAVANIEKIVTTYGYDLETFVMDWEEFRDLQRAYFLASVVDLEVPTDHLITGALYRLAAKNGIHTILSGINYATEWLMPKCWNYRKNDLVNLQAIHKRFGKVKLRKLATIGLWNSAYYHYVHGIRSEEPLNLIDYSKKKAKATLIKEIGWRDYGGKHYESIFTRFYQGYVLPRKYNVDKRKAHLSNLILYDEITRDEAIQELNQPTYDKELQEADKLYVAKKLGFAIEEFENILNAAPVPHEYYGTDEEQRRLYMSVMNFLEPIKRLVRSEK